MVKTSNSKVAASVQAVTETSVTSSVNMNINTTDLVDVVIQTSKEALIKKQNSLCDLLKSIEEAYKFQRNEYLEKILKTRCNKMEKLKIVFPNLINFSINFRVLQETKKTVLGFYTEYPWDIDSINYKNASNYFRKNLRKREVYFEKSDKVFDVKLYSENNTVVIHYSLALLPKEITYLNSLSKAYFSNYLNIKQEMFTIDEQMVEILYNEKGVKAKLIKKSLSGTNAGNNVLQVLSSISGINMLEENV